jgi:hypothetical protein
MIKQIDNQLNWEIDRDFLHVNHDILVEEKLLSIIENFDLMLAINDKHEHNVLIRYEVNKKIWIIKLSLVTHWNHAKMKKENINWKSIFQKLGSSLSITLDARIDPWYSIIVHRLFYMYSIRKITQNEC